MFKGAEMIETIYLRKLVVSLICNTIINNASYMNFVLTKELPDLKFAIENGKSKAEIEKIFNRIDAKMTFLWREFQRYRNFLAPLKMLRE